MIQTGALVLNLSGEISGAHAPHRTRMAQIVLDNAFDLIERATRQALHQIKEIYQLPI